MFKELLKKIAKEFEKEKVPYLVIGGQALLIYGEPRFTRDIDVIIGLPIDKLEKVLELIEDIGLTPLPKNVKEFVKDTYVLPTEDKTSRIRVDLIFSVSTFENEAIKRGVEKEIEGVYVRFVSLEDLIIFKIFSGRERDIEDVRNLLRINRDVDMDYIDRWLKEFDMELGTDLKGKFKRVIKDL